MGYFWNTEKPAPDILRETAQVKRYTDLIRCDSAFRRHALSDPAGAARKAGLRLEEEEIRYYARYPMPEARGLLAVFQEEKAQRRLRRRGIAGTLRQEAMLAWQERQRNRCGLELGRRVNQDLMHLPLAIELSSGCSVGCPFCGLSAERLKRISRADEETMALFAELADGAMTLLGDGAGEAILYNATEPMDTPDYPLFAERFREISGRTPAMTTAVPLRDVEKTRSVLAMDSGADRPVHRFSLLSEDVFRRCIAAFSPEETLYVDFLPRYTESQIGLTPAGRGRSVTGWDGLKTDQGTIACVSGFIVNLAERTLRLTTPCRATPRWPNGEMGLPPVPFRTAGEALRRMEQQCERMRRAPEEDTPLTLQPFLRPRSEVPFALENPGVIRIPLEGSSEEICRMLAEKSMTPEEICDALADPPWQTQLTTAALFRQGILIHTDGFF